MVGVCNQWVLIYVVIIRVRQVLNAGMAGDTAAGQLFCPVIIAPENRVDNLRFYFRKIDTEAFIINNGIVANEHPCRRLSK